MYVYIVTDEWKDEYGDHRIVEYAGVEKDVAYEIARKRHALTLKSSHPGGVLIDVWSMGRYLGAVTPDEYNVISEEDA